MVPKNYLHRLVDKTNVLKSLTSAYNSHLAAIKYTLTDFNQTLSTSFKSRLDLMLRSFLVNFKPQLINIIFIVLSLFLAFLSAEAETTDIYGITFEYEVESDYAPFKGGLNQDGADSKVILLFGERITTTSENLHETIVKAYFDIKSPVRSRARSATIPINRLEQLVINAAKDQSTTIAGAGLYGLVIHPEVTLDQLENLTFKLAKFKSGRKSIREYFNFKAKLPIGSIELPLVYIVAQDEPELLTDLSLSLKENEVNLAKYLASLIFRDYLRDSKYSADKALFGLKKLTGTPKELYTNLETTLNNLDLLQKSVLERTKFFFRDANEISGGNYGFNEAIYSELSNFIHFKVTELVEGKNESEYILWLLAKVPPNHRTVETFNLVQKVLTLSEPSLENGILTPGISTFLEELASINATLKVSYINALKSMAERILSAGQSERVELFIGLIQRVSVGSNPLCNELKLKLSDLYLSKDQLTAAVSVLSQLDNSLPLFKRLKINLFVFWIKHKLMSIVLLVLAGVLATIICINVIKIIRAKAVNFIKSASESDDKDPESPKSEDSKDIPMFVRAGTSYQLTQIAQEYLNLLKILDVKPTSTLEQIKQTYREKLKHLHPDLNKAESKDEATVELMKVRQAYERICEIEREKLISLEEKQLIVKRSESQVNW